MVLVAASHQEQPVRLRLPVGGGETAGKQIKNALAVHHGGQIRVNVPRLRLLQNLRLGVPRRGGDDAAAGVPVGVHKAQGDEAVEPGVGHPLHHRLPRGLGNLLVQFGDDGRFGPQFRAVRAQDLFQPGQRLFLQLPPGVLGEFF